MNAVFSMPTMTATYSPEDNKLRLYSVARLDEETYKRVRGAGFIYAPKQELFVAPAWTPERADLLVELCGDIDDEDKSLAERAEERAERFEDYSERRGEEAETTHAAVERLANGIPLGQPILVGHHSEKRARKDAERIRNGMTKAINLWETAAYWERRAKGAIHHAAYKERPDVRYRRIKTLEADRRKFEKRLGEMRMFVAMWEKATTREQAMRIANYDHSGVWLRLDHNEITVEAAREEALATHAPLVARAERWIAHYTNRIAYERAMLGDAGGLPAERFDLQPGGRVQLRGMGAEWFVVIRVTKKAGEIVSVRTTARYVPVRGVEEVLAYTAPTPEDAAKVKARTTLPPLVNYPGKDFHHMTKAEWDRKHKDYKGTRIVDGVRVRSCIITNGASFVGGGLRHVFLTDVKRVDPPKAPAAEPVVFDRIVDAPAEAPRPRPMPIPSVVDMLKAQLRAGVQVVAAPQLFPTPTELAERMAEIAEIEPSHRVLEPSAGTGQLVRACIAYGAPVVAVEINRTLAESWTMGNCLCADFLNETEETLGTFDRIVMNPPFGGGEDIEHILHAFSLLKPGGRLVALCANGPRQRDKLQPFALAHGGTWEDLPEGTFREQGTGVRVALLTMVRS